MPELIKTNHPAFRPIDVKMGPDGAIYIADWYNPIIQHGEVDFRDPRRDVTHGRIWRVTAKGRQLVERPKLVEAKVEDLLEALKAPEDWTRAAGPARDAGARGEGGAAGAGDVGRRSSTPTRRRTSRPCSKRVDVPGPGHRRTEAAGGAAERQDYRVRAAAVRVAGAWHGRLTNPLELLAPRVADDAAAGAPGSGAGPGAGPAASHAAEIALDGPRPADGSSTSITPCG